MHYGITEEFRLCLREKKQGPSFERRRQQTGRACVLLLILVEKWGEMEAGMSDGRTRVRLLQSSKNQ